MNEEEQASISKYRTINTVTSLASAGLIPMTLIFMLSLKYNTPLYSKLLTRTLMVGAANAFFMLNASSSLHAEFNSASHKYLANLRDSELLDYDNRMKLVIEEAKQRQLAFEKS